MSVANFSNLNHGPEAKKVLAKVASFFAGAPIFSLTATNETKTFRHTTTYGIETIAISGQLLGPLEQGILLQIIATAGRSGKRLLRKNPNGGAPLMLRQLFPEDAKVPTGVGVVILVSVARAELLSAAGLADCEESSAVLVSCLEKLAAVSFKRGTLASQLITFRVDDENTISVALNPLIGAAACLGDRYTGVRLDERQLLATQEARLIHAALSKALWPGDKKLFGSGWLAWAIWQEKNVQPFSESSLTAALDNVLLLQNCGWRVTVEAQSATIWRPGLGLPPKYGAKSPSHPDYKAPRRRSVGWASEGAA